MKKLKYISAIFLLGLFLASCDHSENEIVPDFLDGTQYGVILHVNVSSATTISVADAATSNVNFEVSIEGDKRPVASVAVNKIFVGADGGSSEEMEQTSVSSFPSNVSLSVGDLVNGIPDLAVDSLVAGDGFQMNFTITYADGGVVTRFGTRLNPNFKVTFE